MFRKALALFTAGMLFSPASALAQAGMPSGGFTKVVAQTATASLGFGDFGDTLLTNTGAAGAIVLSLPDCDTGVTGGNPPFEPVVSSTLGARVSFSMTVAQTVDFNPVDTDSIVHVGISPSAGDAVRLAAVVGNHVTLVCTSDNVWQVFGSVGTITDVN